MTALYALSLVAVAAASAGALGLYLRWALQALWLDRPNARSAHRSPVPGSGGVAFVPPWLLALLLLPGLADPLLLGAFAAGATVLCLVGAWDDRRGLSVALRLLFQGLAVAGFLWTLERVQGSLPAPGWLLIVAGVWSVNLFNFMDGIDGLACTQALIALLGAALLALARGGAVGYVVLCALPAAALVAFIPFNRPPARLFMGDAGSLPLGFTLFVLALLGAGLDALPAACWLILTGPFILDASLTLVRRALRGENLAAAHREHLYQRLARRWRSHARVDVLLAGVLLLWCLPMAAVVAFRPEYQLSATVLALLPMGLVMAKLRRLQ